VDINSDKVKYITSRLGIEYHNRYKIVDSISNFININNIKNYNHKMIPILERYYVGFISYDNSHIIFRNINTKCDKKYRYHNFKIFEGNKSYIISKDINIMTPVLNIVLAEGCFDIIGIYNKYSDIYGDNTIYGAVCGNSYLSLIKTIIKRGFMNVDIHIYSDNDIDVEHYKHIKSDILMKNNNINVYYNQIGKDYGGLPDTINAWKLYNF